MWLFVLTVVTLGLYLIYRWSYKAWRNASIKGRMQETQFIERQHREVKAFKKSHKNPSPKAKEVRDFVKNKY